MSRLNSPTCSQECPVIEGYNSPRFAHICQNLGMSQQAPYGWAKMHVKPHIACIAYYASLAAIFAITSILYGYGILWLTPAMHAPYIVNTTLLAWNNIRLWRHGPDIAAVFTYQMTRGVMAIVGLFLLIASFAGPASFVPFSSLIITALGSSLLVFYAFCAAGLGAAIEERPAQPYQSLWPVISNGAFATMRFMDACTDMGVVRILLTQGPDCVWYGEAVPCSFFTRLAALVAVMGATNLILMLAVTTMGGQAALFGGTRKQLRAAIGLNAVIMLLQIGTIIVTLLNVFSDMRDPAATDVERLRREAAFGLISVCSTVAGFCAGVVGMHRLVLLLHAAARSARARVSAASRPASIPPNPSKASAVYPDPEAGGMCCASQAPEAQQV